MVAISFLQGFVQEKGFVVGARLTADRNGQGERERERDMGILVIVGRY